jgi:hypothetical protein
MLTLYFSPGVCSLDSRPRNSRSKLLNPFSGLDASRLGRRAGVCGGPPRP